MGLLVCVAQAKASQRPLFQSYEILDVKIEGDLKGLFEKVAELARDQRSHEAKKLTLPGRLTILNPVTAQTEAYEIEIRVRGNSSLYSGECSFPKLKIRLIEPAPVGSVFAGHEELKIGTHCGLEGVRTDTGRVMGQVSVARESAIYRVLSLLDIPAYRTRLIRFHYDDMGETRLGFFIEDNKAFRARTGTSKAEADFVSAQADRVTPKNLAQLFFSHALFGNYDWGVRIRPDLQILRPLWNLERVLRADGSTLLLPYDFDLSGFITENPWSLIDDELEPMRRYLGRTTEAKLLLVRLQRAKDILGEAVFREELSLFRQRVVTVAPLIESLHLDSKGQELLRKRFGEFLKLSEDPILFELK